MCGNGILEMANGLIKRYKDAQELNRKAKEDALTKAGEGVKKKAPKKKNPYPAGSARAKLWARREREKK